MVAEFQDRPYGSHGEMLPPSRAKQPPPPQPLKIDPPPWADDLAFGNVDLAALAPDAPAPRVHPAVDALAGQFDPPPPEALQGRPVQLEPLQPIKLPPPDWWAEEREREGKS